MAPKQQEQKPSFQVVNLGRPGVVNLIRSEVVNLDRTGVVNLDRSRVVSLNRTGVVNYTGFSSISTYWIYVKQAQENWVRETVMLFGCKVVRSIAVGVLHPKEFQ